MKEVVLNEGHNIILKLCKNIKLGKNPEILSDCMLLWYLCKYNKTPIEWMAPFQTTLRGVQIFHNIDISYDVPDGTYVCTGLRKYLNKHESLPEKH